MEGEKERSGKVVLKASRKHLFYRQMQSKVTRGTSLDETQQGKVLKGMTNREGGKENGHRLPHKSYLKRGLIIKLFSLIKV